MVCSMRIDEAKPIEGALSGSRTESAPETCFQLASAAEECERGGSQRIRTDMDVTELLPDQLWEWASGMSELAFHALGF